MVMGNVERRIFLPPPLQLGCMTHAVRHRGHEFETSKLQNFKTSRLQNFRISELQNFRTSELQNFRTPPIHGEVIPEGQPTF
jgi:hypothetical protein